MLHLLVWLMKRQNEADIVAYCIGDTNSETEFKFCANKTFQYLDFELSSVHIRITLD